MSLVKMTFGNNSTKQVNKIGRGTVKVLKTEKFFGTEELCVIGRLMEGAVARDMAVLGTEKKIISVESNYGEGCCTHKGAQVVLMVSGAEKEEYSRDVEIIFEKAYVNAVEVKPKGKLIIA